MRVQDTQRESLGVYLTSGGDGVLCAHSGVHRAGFDQQLAADSLYFLPHEIQIPSCVMLVGEWFQRAL